jgi:hypothetical protein
MYRLYVDEVGTDDLVNLDNDQERYLSLTGVAMEVKHSREFLTPALNWIKEKVIEHDPDEPVIFHRSDIIRRRKGFWRLKDDAKRDLFDRAIMRVIQNTEYAVITVLVDKKALLRKTEWREKHPYHYPMKVMVEKYVQYLERKSSKGDIWPEGRKGKKDKALQEAFSEFYENGTFYVGSPRVQERLTSGNLKFRYKRDNISGQQLCDLIAHPSHMGVRQFGDSSRMVPTFDAKILEVLRSHKYDRSATGVVKRVWLQDVPINVEGGLSPLPMD